MTHPTRHVVAHVSKPAKKDEMKDDMVRDTGTFHAECDIWSGEQKEGQNELNITNIVIGHFICFFSPQVGKLSKFLYIKAFSDRRSFTL